ncbi:hypothetical protein [Frondihabitans peucedani]|uniref:hypothetical protein n=1 Tax=Frondihabitans peucedani TaxID=598626 RepID=UPI0031D3E490
MRTSPLLRSRLFAVLVSGAVLVAGYWVTSPYDLSWGTAIVRTLWIFPAVCYVGGNIRYHRDRRRNRT